MKIADKGGVKGQCCEEFHWICLFCSPRCLVGSCLVLIGRTGPVVVTGANQNYLAVELGGRGDWPNLAAYFTWEGT